MKKLYQSVDDIWGFVSKIIFVRFQFEISGEELLRLQQKGRIIFALTNGGIFEWLILSSWCRTQKLGPILIANRKSILALSKPLWFLRLIFKKLTFSQCFINNQEGGPRVLFCPARERKELFKPTPVEILLADLHSASSNPDQIQYYIVPVLILWRKYLRGERRKFHELLLGISSNPNWLGKLWYLFRKRHDSIVKSLGAFPLIDRENLSSVEASDAIDESGNLKNARIIRRKILVVTQQEMRVVLGPRYLSPTSVKETLMRDEEVQRTIKSVAVSKAIDNKKVMMTAYQNLTEIVANYTYRFIEVMEVFLSWLFNRVFEGLVVNRDDITRLRETMKTKPVVFVSCHRSHLDYLVVPYVLFTEDMVTPHIAAGVNLSFWPVGYFLRKGGAFFIRRSFRGDELYSLLLKKYIEFLLKNRHNIKFFIEGTRSRSGKMLPPAYGILKMILESYRSRSLEDIALVPVSIVYDEVFEEGSYTKELQGAKKEKESATGLLKSRKIVKRNFGKVYVRFADPLSVKEIVQKADEKNVDPKLTLQKTAFQICKNINDVSPITPKSMVCAILLCHREPSLPLSEILRISDKMVDYVNYSGMTLSNTQKTGFRIAVENTVKNLQKRGAVNIIEGTPRAYTVEQKRRVLLNFYKNNAIHCFVIPAICVVAFFDTLKKRKSSQQSTTAFSVDFLNSAMTLRNVLKFEFFFSPRAIFTEEIKRTLNYFAPGCPWETASDQEWIRGFHEYFKDWDEATVYMGMLGELLESYSTLMKYLKQNPGQISDKKQLSSQIVKFAQGLNEEGSLNFPESISVQNFSNGLLSCENKHYITTEKSGEQTLYKVSPWTHETEDRLRTIEDYLSLLIDRPAVLTGG
ncbi:MAG: 1-acyl-sn-glycerol-3-phosphate acyltransferase [Deltaproteobacteria bacterium]